MRLPGRGGWMVREAIFIFVELFFGGCRRLGDVIRHDCDRLEVVGRSFFVSGDVWSLFGRHFGYHMDGDGDGGFEAIWGRDVWIP